MTRRSRNHSGASGIARRRARALELRESGVTYSSIADVLRDDLEVDTPASYDKAQCWKDIDFELTALRSTVAEHAQKVLTIELRRLDALTEGSWPAAVSGDPAAVRSVLAIMDRRAKLLGLDQPSRVEMALTPDIVRQEIERLERELAVNDDSPPDYSL